MCTYDGSWNLETIVQILKNIRPIEAWSPIFFMFCLITLPELPRLPKPKPVWG